MWGRQERPLRNLLGSWEQLGLTTAVVTPGEEYYLIHIREKVEERRNDWALLPYKPQCECGGPSAQLSAVSRGWPGVAFPSNLAPSPAPCPNSEGLSSLIFCPMK